MILLAVGALLLVGVASSCSNKGVYMNKHRRATDCDCPTFSFVQTAVETHAVA